MKKIANSVKEYFDLNQREFNALLILLAITLLVALWMFMQPYLGAREEKITEEHSRLLKILLNRKSFDTTEGLTAESIILPEKKSEENPLFYFNPNTATKEELIKLGMKEKTALSIIHYREKGGEFRRRQDLKKIYSLKPELYEKLEPFIILPENKKENHRSDFSKKFAQKKREPNDTISLIELNSADSLQLLKLKGIGGYYAHKILKYRSELGGFISKEQLLEIWNFDTARYFAIEKRLVVNPKLIRFISLNKITFEGLKNHPYIRYKNAKAIISYRDAHKGLSSADELSKIILLDKKIIDKIRPYLIFE